MIVYDIELWLCKKCTITKNPNTNQNTNTNRNRNRNTDTDTACYPSKHGSLGSISHLPLNIIVFENKNFTWYRVVNLCTGGRNTSKHTNTNIDTSCYPSEHGSLGSISPPLMIVFWKYVQLKIQIQLHIQIQKQIKIHIQIQIQI